jgi:hypothetical protein
VPRLIESPTVIPAVGAMPKRIEEYTGRVNTGQGGQCRTNDVAPRLE